MAPHPANDSPVPPADPNQSQLDPGWDSECQQIWQTVYDAAKPGLCRFLANKLPQMADVEDCLQSLLIKMLTNASKNTNRVPPMARRAWLFRVASNEAHSWWRKHAANQTTQSLDPTQDTANHQTSSPSDAISQTEQAEHAREAIEQLKPEWRTVVRLRLIDEMTFQEIADHLNIPLGTALTRMRRAMQHLRNELDTDF